MLTKIISGGQTGADKAALIAARIAGYETGGWAPKGWVIEGGVDLTLPTFGLKECETSKFNMRTKLNVRTSDGTLCFVAVDSPGSNLTYNECEKQRKPFRGVLCDALADRTTIVSRITHEPREIAEWIEEQKIHVLNVAGNRESKAPGIGKAVEDYLRRLFAILKK